MGGERHLDAAPPPCAGASGPETNISLHDAIRGVKAAATSKTHSPLTEDNRAHASIEVVDLLNSVGRCSGQDVIAQFATPPADTSAMDGFAVSSFATSSASHERPVRFAVKGSTVAGARTTPRLPCIPISGIWPCVEIATGARFPEVETGLHSDNRGHSFDCVVPYEHVTIETCCLLGKQHIVVRKPLQGDQHRRFAGDDIGAGSIVLREGALIRPQHIMTLASLGLTKVAVRRRLRIGLWSTGDEVIGMDERSQAGSVLAQERHRIFDANGPYIMSQLTYMGFDAEFLGSVKDQEDCFAEHLAKACISGYDLLLSSGAVSAGRFDFVRSALEKTSAKIVFHGVRMRPGHPLLFAEVLSKPFNEKHRRIKNDHDRPIGFFGLPGNPIAAAVGFRFFVIPYLHTLQGLPEEKPSVVVVRFAGSVGMSTEKAHTGRTKPKDRDVYWHGILQGTDNSLEFLVSKDQSPSKVAILLESSGWVHVPSGYSDVKDGDKLAYYPILPR